MTTPYFYIIKHKESGIKYAGCRFANGCHPDELLKEDGYTTSSKTINKIIDSDGIDSFEIVKIDIICDGLDVYEYETKFLVENDCARSKEWYNHHNNIQGFPAYGTPEYAKLMMQRFGYANANQNPLSVEKGKQTKKIKYGNSGYNNQLKMKETMLKRYGVKCATLIPEALERSKKTRIERYGDCNNMQKNRNTMKERYGVEYTYQNKDILNKMFTTKLNKYGSKDYNNIEKAKQTNIERYGYSVKLADKEFRKQFYKTCPYCNKTMDSGNYSQWHGDKCKKKTKE